MALRAAVSIFVILSGVGALHAADPQDRQLPKAPWEWTVEERIDLRLEPVARERRVAEHNARFGRNPADSRTFDSIDGSKNPELFMPWELFATISREARDAAYVTRDERLRAAGFDPAKFWTEVRAICAPLFELEAREADFSQLYRVSSPAEWRSRIPEYLQIQRDVCGARIDALGAARSHFGADKFDRFLYSVVAPQTASAISDTGGDDLDPRSRLLALAQGCR